MVQTLWVLAVFTVFLPALWQAVHKRSRAGQAPRSRPHYVLPCPMLSHSLGAVHCMRSSSRVEADHGARRAAARGVGCRCQLLNFLAG
jgi:hypothetical protein